MIFFQKEATESAFDIMVGELSRLEGHVKSQGAVRIDGYLKGDIDADGHVVIGPQAEVYGNISASQIEVSGRVEGNVKSTGMLRIYSSGLLRGDIEVMSFDIEEGGAFEGLCQINTSAFDRKVFQEKDSNTKEKTSEKNNSRRNTRNGHRASSNNKSKNYGDNQQSQNAK